MEQSGGEIRGVWIVGKASAKTESPCIHGVYGTWKKAIAALEGIRRHYIDDGGVCPSECSFTPVEDGQCLLYIKASEMRTHTFSAVEYQIDFPAVGGRMGGGEKPKTMTVNFDTPGAMGAVEVAEKVMAGIRSAIEERPKP